ncbi:MAG TPA: DUF6776 family protein [Rhodocyclaceae bacterium]
MPWHWRLLSGAVILAVALALSGWIYDAGRSFAGFHSQERQEEIDALRGRVTALEEEATQLRKVANASDSSIAIERTTQQHLGQEAKRLEAENARLKEELAVFEKLASGSGKTSDLGISRFSLEPEGAAGTWRYRALLTAGGEKEVDGRLEISVKVLQGDKLAMLTFPAAEKDGGAWRVVFRRFRRHEGSFVIPQGARIKEAELRLLVGGSVVGTQKTSF